MRQEGPNGATVCPHGFRIRAKIPAESGIPPIPHGRPEVREGGGGHSPSLPPHLYLLVGLLLLCHHAGLQGQFVSPSPPAHLVKGQKTASVTHAGTASPPAQRNRRAVRQGRRIPLSVHPIPTEDRQLLREGGWATPGGAPKTHFGVQRRWGLPSSFRAELFGAPPPSLQLKGSQHPQKGLPVKSESKRPSVLHPGPSAAV